MALRRAQNGTRAARFLARLIADPRGGTAVIFAVAVPILAVLSCGAVDLSSLYSDRTAMQDVADATALDAAKQLGIGSPQGIAARATGYARVQLRGIATRVSFGVTTVQAPDNSQVTVKIDGHRQSFFANLLPPGGWNLHVQATAANLGRTPLCVLSSGAGGQNAIAMGGGSQATAAGCLVQSNGDIAVTNTAALQAGVVQSSGAATGAISPAPQVGAPTIPDPFANMSIHPPLPLCLPISLVYSLANIVPVLPGTHCGSITVQNGATLHLLPGEHYFSKGSLILKNNSTLVGDNVVLIFDDTSQFSFTQSSTVDLSGRTSGPYAGFVVATTRNNTGTFGISSDSARKMLGTIYIPNATLNVTGQGNRVADQSAWTVVVAKSIQMTGSPQLIINSAYAGSGVPVPNGVGPTGGNKVKLAR